MTVYAVPPPPPETSTPLVSPRGAQLATRVWKPKASIQSLCLIVPGGGWHSGYFDGLARHLNESGVFVTSYDVVGSGYSDPEPGAPEGYLYVREFHDLVEDIFAAANWTKEQAKVDNVPFFLLGESFGGLQVLAAALEPHPPVQFDGIITLGAALEIAPDILPPTPVIWLLSVLAKYYPKLTLPVTDTSSTFDQAFGDPEWAKVARQDPGVSVSLHPTVGFASASLSSSDSIKQNARSFDAPLLAIHAIQDCRTVCEAMQQFVDQVGSRAEGLWLDDTTGHQLLQDREIVTSRVMRKVSSWIRDQAAKHL